MSKLALVAMVTVTSVACLGSDFEQSLHGSWQLTSATVDGTEIPLIASHPITITFEEEEVSGTAACNRFSGGFDLSGSNITFGSLALTEMACFPPEVMDLEMTFVDALIRVTTVAIDNGLVLSGPDVELTFAVVEPVPDAGLTNTVWVLESLIEGESVSSVVGERASIEFFTDGSILGGTGCRHFSGSYQIDGTKVMITEIVPGRNHCAPAIADQDDHVLAVLEGDFAAEIRANTLTITGSGDLGLVYSVES